jgi:hypothetical protein
MSVLVLSCTSLALAQDVDSGPAKGSKVPELKVHAVSGPVQGETVDYAAKREGKPTVYLLIPADKFSRPMFGFMKALEKAVVAEIKDGLVVAVWLTDDQQKTKDYLPRITQYFQSSALTYFPGEKAGPKGWNINDQADVTVIVANRGTVIGRYGYNSINDTVVKDVMKAFPKEIRGK